MDHDLDPAPAPADVPAGQVQHALDRAPVAGVDAGGSAGLAGGDTEADEPDAQHKDPLRVLILFSDTGGGHRAAAGALEEGIKTLEPDAHVARADPLLQGRSRTVSRLASLYSPVIRYLKPLWGLLYHASNTSPAFGGVRAVFGPTVRASLEEVMAGHAADVVVTVHPLLADVARQAIDEMWPGVPLAVVVTDLSRFHRGWRSKRADLVVVPSEAARREFAKKGVRPDRVAPLGLPVSPRFRPPAPGERAALRRVFGLEEERFTILVSGGGEGSGQLEEQVEALANRSGPWQLLVVTGRNLRARKHLLAERHEVPVQVLGFVDNMPDLMRASDLVVSKAGPGAIAEALATGLPIVVTGYLPGQETPNVDFVTESGFGRYAPRPAQLRKLVEELSANAEDGPWRQMSARAAELARPYAALEIARELLRLAVSYREASQARR